MMTRRNLGWRGISLVLGAILLAPARATPSEPTITTFSQQFCLREIAPNLRWDLDLSVTEAWDTTGTTAILVDRQIELDVTGTGPEGSPFYQFDSYSFATLDSDVLPDTPAGVQVNFSSSYPGPSSAYLTYDESIYTHWRL